MPKSTKRKVEIVTRTVGSLITPIITVTDVPTEVEVGDKVIPRVKVEKEIGVPIENVSVDFFIEDILQVSTLGDRQTTNINGEAVASEGYYIGIPDADQTIKFIIVVHRKKLP